LCIVNPQIPYFNMVFKFPAARQIGTGGGALLFDVGGAMRRRSRAAAIYSLIETAKLNDADPEAYLRNVLTRIATYPARRIAGLPPWN